MRIAPLLAALALSACAARGPLPDLPPRAGLGDRTTPALNALANAAESFARPSRLRARPAEAAVAAIQVEWLAEAAWQDPPFTRFGSFTPPAMNAARNELRAALGVADDASPTDVIAALDAAAAALARNDARAADAALSPPLFAPGAAARLGTLPRLPTVNDATFRALNDAEFGSPVERDDVALPFPARG